MNPYEVLEVAVGATAEEVKAAYHAMAKKWHPDRFTGAAKADAEIRFRMLAEAYAMLKDNVRRADASPSPAPPPQPQAQPQSEATPRSTGPIPLDTSRSTERPVSQRSAEDWFKDAKAAADAKALEKALAQVQYAIRMDGERAEYHAFLAKMLNLTGGDKRTLVRTLETALRLNPKDVESTILLATTFQGLGMHARASRLWGIARNLAPNHPIFAPAGKQADGRRSTKEVAQNLGDQLSAAVDSAKDAVRRLFKRNG